MKLDSITLSSVLSEIKNNYLPSKIVEVKQISKYEISFALKNKQILRNLFISIRPDRMAFFIKESFFSEDNFPSLFLKQLKSWIEGGMLTDAQHYDFDRFIKLSIEPYNRFGKIKKYQLLIEFMGKHSNIVLIDDEEIIKAPLKQVGSDVNRFREIKSGNLYVYPPQQEKNNLLKTGPKQLIQIWQKYLAENKENYLWEFFLDNFKGIGGKTAQEIVSFLGFSPKQIITDIDEQKFNLLSVKFSLLIEKIKNNNFNPTVLINNSTGQIVDYFLLSPSAEQDYKLIPFQNTSSCLDFIYNKLTEKEKKQNLYNITRKIIIKNIEKLTEIESSLLKREKEILNCEEYKKKGELLKANLWKITPGSTEVKVIDYTDNSLPEIMILLNPQLSPLQNLTHLFQKYKKLKKNADMIQKQIDNNKQELSELIILQNKVNKKTNSLEDLICIYNQLMKLGYIKKNNDGSLRKKAEQQPAISKFLSPDGWTILVGKNNKQNEYILRNLSTGNDFWLHNLTKPGGHVIIKNHNNLDSPPYLTLNFAASLASYYSKTKDKETAYIIYTKRKYVRKAKNSKPGKVIYTNEKTFPVTIEYETIKNEIDKMIVV